MCPGPDNKEFSIYHISRLFYGRVRKARLGGGVMLSDERFPGTTKRK